MSGAKENGSRARALRLALAVAAAVALAACGSRGEEPIAVDEQSVTWRASDYCRATTCPPPAGWPQGDACAPEGWASACAAEGRWDVPLWWRTGCIGWSLQKDASRRVSFADAETAAQAAFAAWTSASCRGGAPSIAAIENPAVVCAKAAHSDTGGNQSEIVFHDDVWPEPDPAITIALTTTWYDPRTGEILDADIEVNEVNFAVGVHGEAYDLETVLTHEVGHFLGLAHSSTPASVMYPSDEGTNRTKDTLAPGDVAAICSIYPADGTRRVSTVVSGSGSLAAGTCDPTPMGGFATTCD